jgi:hypothetical protein
VFSPPALLPRRFRREALLPRGAFAARRFCREVLLPRGAFAARRFRRMALLPRQVVSPILVVNLFLFAQPEVQRFSTVQVQYKLYCFLLKSLFSPFETASRLQDIAERTFYVRGEKILNSS